MLTMKMPLYHLAAMMMTMLMEKKLTWFHDESLDGKVELFDVVGGALITLTFLLKREAYFEKMHFLLSGHSACKERTRNRSLL